MGEEEKGRGTANWVREKLDRVPVSGSWCDLFPRASVWSMEGGTSDHMSLFLTTSSHSRTCYRRRPRFENSWSRNPKCREVVGNPWSRLSRLGIVVRLEQCENGVWNWGKRLKGEEEIAIRHCKIRLG